MGQLFFVVCVNSFIFMKKQQMKFEDPSMQKLELDRWKC